MNLGLVHLFMLDSVDSDPDGAGLCAFGTVLPESQFHYNDRHGAQLITATTTEMKLEAHDDQGTLIDSYTANKACN